jgi:septum formation protein
VISPAPLVLASTSPYRRALLERLGLTFRVEAPGVDEAHRAREPFTERALRLAHAKAEAIAARDPAAVVIGSDQVAESAGVILDKAGDAAAARAQLARLSGARAQFHTACALHCRSRGLRAVHLDTTTVVFRTLAAAEIERYIEREQPYDCASSFKAESLGIVLLERIESVDPSALIGLPLIWLSSALRAAGYALP